MPADAAKAAGLLFLVVVVQLSVMANVDILGGHPNLLLVTVVCVSLCAAPSSGRAGCSAGLLADTGVFGTLGFTALLLTLAGYWTGRYGETTGRDRAHAPLLSIAVITILYQVAALVLRYLAVPIEDRAARSLDADVAALVVLSGAEQLLAVQDLERPESQEERGEDGERHHPEQADPQREFRREAVGLFDSRVRGKKAS